jgi:hypothetical protein
MLFPSVDNANEQRMVDPIIIYYGKGLMRSFLCDPECVFDVVST